MRGSRTPAWLESLLILVAIICLGWWTAVTLHGRYVRSQKLATFDSATAKIAPPIRPVSLVKRAAAAPAPRERLAPGSLVGVLDVPRLGISTPVIAGDDENALAVAAGHLTDTPLPWEHGNSAVAAHRDTMFRPLRGVRPGDAIMLHTSRGDFEYTVKDFRIVNPDDLSVLASGKADSLTLITCYPFSFIGHAPKRFVVRAERRGAPAAAQAPAPVAKAAPARTTRRAANAGQPQHAAAVKRAAAPRAARVSTARPAKSATAARAAAPRKITSARVVGRDEPPKKKRRWYQIF